MDRGIVYPGSIPLDTDILAPQKNAMVGLGWLAQAVLGATTLASGLGCVPTGPASLQVVVNPGAIFTQGNTDTAAYGSLGADTTHQLVKQGLLLDAATLSCPAPGTAGQSINYLIEAQYQDVDDTPVVLPYYNAANPALAWSGPGNSGTPQNTFRRGKCVVQVKAGTAAATGSQVTPSADAGWTGLWVVTVANGQTTIVGGNIAQLAGSPLILETLTTKISQTSGDARYAALAGLISQPFNASTLNVTGGNIFRRNALYNGGHEIWQRGTSIGIAASNNGYGADRFALTTGASQACTISQVAGLTNTSQWAAKVQRNAAQTGTTVLVYEQPLELADIIRLRGQIMTVSFTAKAGANWSPASGTLSCTIAAGTGTAARRGNAAYAGETVPLTFNNNLTGSAVRYTGISAAIPLSATQLSIYWSWTPVGTAGADDSFSIDDIQFEIGGVATTFEFADTTLELARCKRYFDITSMAYTTIGIAGAQTVAFWFFKAQMRVIPTLGGSSITGTPSVGTDGLTSTSGVAASASIPAGATASAEL